MNLHRWMLLTFFLGSLQVRAQDFSPVFTEEQRLMGFAEHNRTNRDSDQLRSLGTGEVKKDRLQWEEQLKKSVNEYKEWKQRQAQSLDEKSPEYKAEKKYQHQQIKEHEQFRTDYVRERDRQLAKRKSHVLLTEEHEYKLDEVVVRADVKDRALYGGKVSWLKNVKNLGESPGKGGSGGSTSSAPDFGAPPPSPTPSSGPDFYEPEIPPPPPPEPGSFDESIPPPIFDDPEF